MSKDAYYFSHDSNAKDDPKCMLLIDQLGLEGYGIFWVLIEVLRDQPEYSYPLKLVPILARRYNTTAEKMMTVIQKYGLFEFSQEENFFSLSLNKRMERADELREQKRIAGKASAERRRLLSEGQSEQNSTPVQHPFNKCSTMKRKEKKGKEIKRNILDAPAQISFKDLKLKREVEFREKVSIFTDYSKEMLSKFCDYWTESSPNDKKMRFEKEKVFDISRRLQTWSSREFNNTTQKNKPNNRVNDKWK